MAHSKRKNDEVHESFWSLNGGFFDIIMWLPSLTFMFLVTFYLLASLEVGHLPVYGNPDPKDSIFAPFMNVIWVAMLMTMFTLPYGIVFTIFHFVEHQSASTVWTRLAVYIVPIIVFFILNYYSPIMLWFAD